MAYLIRPGAGRAAVGLRAVLAALAVLAAGSEIRPDWRTPLERAGIRFISALELRAMMVAGAPFTLVDARDAVHYHRERLPGAISVPAEDRPLKFVDIRRPKRLFHPERLPLDRSRALVFYCGGPN